jgi:beta-phosphoglucomutase-like phosphatase (HAD superfamily)
MFKGWFFDCDGQMIKESFQTEEQAFQFARNHGLEIFKIEEVNQG